jgi:transposase
MLTADTVLRGRLAAKRDGHSVRGIAKKYRLSRNSVRRYLRSEGVEPRCRRRQEVKPRLGPYLADVEQLLREEGKRPLRERRSAPLLFAELQRRGYEGAYDSVRRHVQAWKREHRGSKEVFIPLHFAPGEAFQFDW